MAYVLGGVVLGLLAGIAVFVLLKRTQGVQPEQLSLLVSGVHGEERLRTFEQRLGAELKDVRDAAHRIADVVHQVDQQRGESIAGLVGQIESSRHLMASLQETTAKLASLLSNSQTRGQWGERIADDLLKAAGFIEGIHYDKQSTTSSGRRPDFSLRVSEGRVLNMDVKFPIASFVRAVQAPTDEERVSAERQFLNDVRATVRALASRDYIDPPNGTLDFVLLFIPNERLFQFVNEQDVTLVDEALGQHVVLCSPMMLFSLLSVVRQAADAFVVAQSADHILRALGDFTSQWEKYKQTLEKVGRGLTSAQKAWDELQGVRTRQLEKRLDEIERIRNERGLKLAPNDRANDPSEVEETPQRAARGAA